MVKLTLIGRLSDGLPLSQTPEYLNEKNQVSSFYKQQGELLLREISIGALTCPKMTLLIEHHCFHYLIGDGVCYITLCETWYPRKLAFQYLQDLRKEFEKVDMKLVASFSVPYAFTRFDYVIESIRTKYLDTRTQANLSKLNADCRQDLDVVTEELSKVISSRQPSGSEGRIPSAETHSTIWSSQQLEVIALKWTPITVFVITAAVLLWTGIVTSEYSMIGAS